MSLAMEHAQTKGPDRPAEAFLTGVALGQIQVTLGLYALSGTGASAATWFVTLLCWLVGGLVGALWQKRKPAAASEQALAYAVVGLLWTCAATAQIIPFSLFARLSVLLAALCGGALSGRFLASRSQRSTHPARLFFHENNGFLCGFVFASVLLLVCAPLLLPVATVLLWLARVLRRQHAQEYTLSIILGILSVSFQLSFRSGGDPAWDGLMTAEVLSHVSTTHLSDWLFFAHPLVIPLTAPFRLLVDDPLRAVVVREATCMGGVVVLLALSASAICKDRQRGLFAMFVAALLFLFSGGRYQLTLSGEEKQIALLFATLFQTFYLVHRGHLRLDLPQFLQRSPVQRRILLAILLTLAVSVHLINGLLCIWLLCDLCLSLRRRNTRSAGLRDIGGILLATSALLAPLSLALSVFVGQAKTPRAVLSYFFEYHLSGEFFSLPDSYSLRLLDVESGLRAWFCGPYQTNHPILEAVLCALLLLLVFWRSHRLDPQLTVRLLLWLALLFAHFFFFEPANPEAWGPSAFALTLLLTIGLCGSGALPARLLAVCGIAGLAFLLGRSQQESHSQADSVSAFVGAEASSDLPLRELTRFIDINIEPDALLLVDDRLLSAYFHLYSKRSPLVRPYVGIAPAELRSRYHLTTLSLRFFSPNLSPQDVDARILRGHPVYLLASFATDSESQPLPYHGLHLSRIRQPLYGVQTLPKRPPLETESGAKTDDLLANDLSLLAVTVINPTVYRLTLARGSRQFSAKWKPMGIGGSEQQEGFDGNNAPRCEVAAKIIDRWLADGDSQRELVPDVVLRAFHRNVPCDRSCKDVPRILGEEFAPTFPAWNDHLVLGALTAWIDDGQTPSKFHDGLWNPQRFAREPDYRSSVANLATFLSLIAHGDANYADNFLVREGPPFRVFSIDNGRSLDGIPFYSDDADPDWEPLRHLAKDQLFLPQVEPRMLARLGQLPQSPLLPALYVVSAVDLIRGKSVADVHAEPRLRPFVDRPLAQQPAAKPIGRGTYLIQDPANSGLWLVQGISAQGVADVAERARALVKRYSTGKSE